MHVQIDATQEVFALSDGQLATLVLPAARKRVAGSAMRWGYAETPLTPAYWAAQSWMWQLDAPDHFRLGRSLAEELLACMLGGHGIPAEVGLAAYYRLRDAMHASAPTLADERQVFELLSEPLVVNARPVRYRFARQKAAYVSAAFGELPAIDEALEDRPLRDRLIALRGVGPKTASWVVRNLRGSDDVAILDIHILRAGRQLGIFEASHTVERHYSQLEDAYLAFARAIATPASILDSVMWMTMRSLSQRATPTMPSPSRRTVPMQQQQLAL